MIKDSIALRNSAAIQKLVICHFDSNTHILRKEWFEILYCTYHNANIVCIRHGGGGLVATLGTFPYQGSFIMLEFTRSCIDKSIMQSKYALLCFYWWNVSIEFPFIDEYLSAI